MPTLDQLPEGTTGQSTDVTAVRRGATTYKLTIAALTAGLVGIVGTQLADDTIPVTKLADGTAGQLITWDATGEATTTAAGLATQVLTSNGAGTAPTFQAPAVGYTDEQAQDAVGAMVGDSITYVDATPLLHLAAKDYGDFTCTGTSAVCGLDSASVDYADLANGGALSVMGRSANTAGVRADIACTAGGGGVLRESGSVLGCGTIQNAAIANTTITVGKLAQITGLTVLGNAANIVDNVNPITATAASGAVLRESGSTIGWGTITSAAVSDLAGSTWTPTLTSVANVTSSTAYQCQYLRVGATVTASCKIEVTSTTGETLTQLGISLPVASNFGAAEDCVGPASTTIEWAAYVLADATNNRCELNYSFPSSGSHVFYTTFTYQVL